jgi:hypothetical protein
MVWIARVNWREKSLSAWWLVMQYSAVLVLQAPRGVCAAVSLAKLAAAAAVLACVCDCPGARWESAA